MKSTLSISIICCFIVSSCLLLLPSPARAKDKDTAIRRVFIDTLYGLGTGVVIATAVTMADGDAHGDDWGRNLGIGATIGAVVGATYGMAVETRSLVSFDGNRLGLHCPIPQIKRASYPKHSNVLFLNIFAWNY